MFGFFKKSKWPRQAKFITGYRGGLLAPSYQIPLSKIIEVIKRDPSSMDVRIRIVEIAYKAANEWFEDEMEHRFPDFELYVCNAVRGHMDSPFLLPRGNHERRRPRVETKEEVLARSIQPEGTLPPHLQKQAELENINADLQEKAITGPAVRNAHLFSARPATVDKPATQNIVQARLDDIDWEDSSSNIVNAAPVQEDTGIRDISHIRTIPDSLVGKDLPTPNTRQFEPGYKKPEIAIDPVPGVNEFAESLLKGTQLAGVPDRSLRDIQGSGADSGGSGEREPWHGDSTKTELNEYTGRQIDEIMMAGELSGPNGEDLVKEIGQIAVREAFVKFREYLKKRPYRAEMDGNPGQEQRFVNSYFLFEYLDVKIEEIDRDLEKAKGNGP